MVRSLPAVSGRAPHHGASMLRENQDSFAGLLILRKAEGGDGGDAAMMSNRPADGFNAMLCPACTRPMAHVRTIWRAFHDDLQVFECRVCDVSVSVKVPPKPE
jgi:hypothetical protein